MLTSGRPRTLRRIVYRDAGSRTSNHVCWKRFSSTRFDSDGLRLPDSILLLVHMCPNVAVHCKQNQIVCEAVPIGHQPVGLRKLHVGVEPRATACSSVGISGDRVKHETWNMSIMGLGSVYRPIKDMKTHFRCHVCIVALSQIELRKWDLI